MIYQQVFQFESFHELYPPAAFLLDVNARNHTVRANYCFRDRSDNTLLAKCNEIHSLATSNRYPIGRNLQRYRVSSNVCVCVIRMLLFTPVMLDK